MSLPTTAYDRPGLALRLALRGRPSAAAMGLIAPQKLGPSDLRTFADDLTDEDDSSVLKAIVGAATNPVVLAGLLVGVAFPVARSATAMQIRNTVVNYTKNFGPILQKILPFIDQLPADMADDIDDLVVGQAHTKEWWSQQIGKVLKQYNKMLGRPVDAALEAKSGVRIASLMEKLDDVGIVSKELGLDSPVLSREAVAQFAKKSPRLYQAEVKAADGIRDVLDMARAERFGNKAETIVGSFLSKAKSNRSWLGLNPKSRFVNYKGSVSEAIDELKKFGISASGETMDDVANAIIKSRPKDFPSFLLTDAKSYEKLAADAARKGVSISLDHLDDYFPHLRQFSGSQMETMFEMGAKEGIDPHLLMNAASRAAGKGLKAPSLKRLGRLAPNLDELDDAWGAGSVSKQARNQIKIIQDDVAAEVEKFVSASNVGSPEQRVANLGKSVSDFAQKAGLSVDEVEEISRAIELAGMSDGMDGAQRVAKAMMSSYAPGGGMRTYSSKLVPVMEQYGKAMASMEWWTFRGVGDKILRKTKLLDNVRQQRMYSEYIPQLMGKKSFAQSMQSAEAMQNKLRWMEMAKNKQGVFKFIPEAGRKYFLKAIESQSGGIGKGAIGNSLASYFYTSTLGFNAPSAMKNLLQTTLTTMPTAGTKNTLKGVGVTNKQIGRYFSLRQAGKTAAEAFHEAFDEFIEAGLDPSPITEQIMKGSLESAYSGAIQANPTTVSKVKDMAMMMFQGSERYNRLVAFNTGRAWYQSMPNTVKNLPIWDKAAGALSAEGRFARRFVQLTQFPAGPLQTPHMINQWSPLFRQFAHFPLRFLGSLATSGFRGAATGLAGGFNPGMIGRAAATSAITYEAAKELLGVDLSSGLLMGALPLPAFEGAPFYPAPIVPPVLSAAGSIFQSAVEGSLDPLKQAAWLGVPGGIAARRVYRALGPGYADWKNRTPDGLVPTYSSQGTLVGNYTPTQMTMKALGLYPNSQSQERELMGYLSSQRDEMAGIRRDYMEAIAANDGDAAHNISREWESRFPGMGPISVRQQDVDAIKMRKQVTRLERMLDSIPSEYRDEYAQIVTHTLGGEFERMIGVNPQLFEAPRSTWRSRRLNSNSFRYRPTGQFTANSQPLGGGFGVPSLTSNRGYGFFR